MTDRLRHPGHPEPLGSGETVVLIDRKDRRYVVRLEPGATFHYHAGAVMHDVVIGLTEGSRVRSSQGAWLWALRPTAEDWTLKAPRGAQVVYPKDQALIVGLADIAPGVTVVEAGAGSGALTSALLRAVGPQGRVLSFELRPDHAEVATRNVRERFGGHPANWELRCEDVVDGLAGVTCDRIVLDLLEAWEIVKPAAEALRPGGVIATYTPTVPQVMRLRQALDEDARWGMAKTLEAFLRPWQVSGLAVRPAHRMVAHTGFLTVARRLNDRQEGNDGRDAPE